MDRTGGGSIVNISSIASVRPPSRTTVYATAKGGLNALTSATARSTPRWAFGSTTGSLMAIDGGVAG